MVSPIVVMKDVVKKYGDLEVVKSLNLEVDSGEFLTLLGPSGCGKTTTLRMIAGFEAATSGIISVENERVEDKEPYERNVNTVFQNYSLFPHMSIFENVAYGLTVKKKKKAEIKEKVLEMLEMVQLNGYENRKPDQISGGQKQRVAIARALVNHPKVLLLDEPLGALDMKLRKQMQLELKRLQKKLGITFIFVTHDQEEALTMSDRIAVMNGGILEQVGSSKEIYDSPNTRFVADFIGESNLFEGLIKKFLNEKEMLVGTEVGDIPVRWLEGEIGENIDVCIRPEYLKFSPEKILHGVPAVVKDFIFAGSIIKTILQMNNGLELIVSTFTETEGIHLGDLVYVYWETKHAVPIRRKENLLMDVLAQTQREVFYHVEE